MERVAFAIEGSQPIDKVSVQLTLKQLFKVSDFMQEMRQGKAQQIDHDLEKALAIVLRGRGQQ
jgi:hypothetical protein